MAVVFCLFLPQIIKKLTAVMAGDRNTQKKWILPIRLHAVDEKIFKDIREA